MSKKLHLLRAGQYQDHSGQPVTLSERDLEQIAASYSPDVHEAPIVIGHPQTDAPAWGWITSLSADRAGLHAETGQLNPEFAEAVRAGQYKKISVALYGPTHPNNPADDWYLRHVGFLGAQPPVVKGLAQAQFAEQDPPTLTTEIALAEADIRPWVFGSIARLLRGLREWVIDKHTLEDADRILPKYDIEQVESEEARLIDQQSTRSLAEGAPLAGHKENPNPEVTPEDKTMSDDTKGMKIVLAEREAALAAREAKVQAAEERAAQAVKQQAEAEAAQFAERLAGEGRILPRHQAGLARILTLLPPDAAAEFAEGEGQSAAPAVFLRDFLATLPPQVQFGEAAPATSPPPASSGRFNAPASVQVRPDRLALHDQAVALSEADANLSYIQAVSRLQRQSQEAQS